MISYNTTQYPEILPNSHTNPYHTPILFNHFPKISYNIHQIPHDFPTIPYDCPYEFIAISYNTTQFPKILPNLPTDPIFNNSPTISYNIHQINHDPYDFPIIPYDRPYEFRMISYNTTQYPEILPNSHTNTYHTPILFNHFPKDFL